MDRNFDCRLNILKNVKVATREGGVDRNRVGGVEECKSHVATREGGVDRNFDARYNVVPGSSRHPRGWRG